jgi:hypothetical protein
MRPPLLIRIRWWLSDVFDASWLSGLRWKLHEFRTAPRGGRIVLGSLLLLVLLVGGGFATARAVAGSSSSESKGPAVRIITTRQKVRVKVNGHVVTRWRTRRLYAEAKTVMQTQTIHTANGIRIIKRPVTRYHVVYRKGGTKTLARPVTDVRTLTNTSTSTSTRLVTVTNRVTDTQTITQPVTVVDTTTVVSTETDTLPVTVTVTLPGG